MTLTNLAARVEAAAGADRALDYAICEGVMGGWHAKNDYRRLPGDDGWYSASPPIAGCEKVAPAQDYTASLDAAMSLASRPEIEQFGGTPAMVREAMDRLSRVHGDLSMAQTKGYAELLARFVTAASLRAIEAGRSTEGE